MFNIEVKFDYSRLLLSSFFLDLSSNQSHHHFRYNRVMFQVWDIMWSVQTSVIHLSNMDFCTKFSTLDVVSFIFMTLSHYYFHYWRLDGKFWSILTQENSLSSILTADHIFLFSMNLTGACVFYFDSLLEYFSIYRDHMDTDLIYIFAERFFLDNNFLGTFSVHYGTRGFF